MPSWGSYMFVFALSAHFKLCAPQTSANPERAGQYVHLTRALNDVVASHTGTIIDILASLLPRIGVHEGPPVQLTDDAGVQVNCRISPTTQLYQGNTAIYRP